MQQREATSVLPVHCWNTAVSCLACLADSLSLDLPFEQDLLMVVLSTAALVETFGMTVG